MFNFGRTQVFFFISEALVILYYGLFTVYGEGTSPFTKPGAEQAVKLKFRDVYSMF
jgi:hypothetical protein